MYNWDINASQYHIDLHHNTLLASIQYCENRKYKDVVYKNKLEELNKELNSFKSFYKIEDYGIATN